MLSRPLSDALERLGAEFQSTRALIHDLPADAAFSIAATEPDEALVRLLALASLDELGDRHAFEIFDLLTAADWLEWDMPAVQAITEWADAWWLTSLRADPEFCDAGDVLGQLTHLRVPMVKWLRTWLAEIDGPGAQHLARFIIDGSDHPGWNGMDDERGQVLAWARTDSVINGFTMIGGVHLEPGQLALVIDRIVVTPGLPADAV